MPEAENVECWDVENVIFDFEIVGMSLFKDLLWKEFSSPELPSET